MDHGEEIRLNSEQCNCGATEEQPAIPIPSLMDLDDAECHQNSALMHSDMVPTAVAQTFFGTGPSSTGTEAERSTAQNEHAIEWMSGLSLVAGTRGTSAVASSADSKAWHVKLGPHRSVRPPWANAHAQLGPRRRQDFRVIKTPKKPRISFLGKDIPFDLPPSLVAHRSPEEVNRLAEPEWSPKPEDLVMADVDERRDNRRRGGGGRHAGQKRRFQEDDDNDRRPQQRRFERPEYPSARARRLVWTIADNPIRNAEEDVVAIAKLLADNAGDEIFCDRVSNDIVQVVQEQPFKIPFVAAIVLYTNQHKPEFVQMIVTRATARTQAVLDAGDWRTFKLLLRFFACMQTMFEGDGCFGLLDDLFNKAADLQSASSEDALGLELVKIIMLTIPYVLAATGATFAQQASELLSKTDIIASAPREVDIVNPYVSAENYEGRQLPSVIGLLQKQLQNEEGNGWPLAFIPRLFKPAQTTDAEESTATQKHPFPPLSIPQDVNPGIKILFPELYFSLYADQDIETVPPTTQLAASMLRDTLVDTIGILDFNRNAAAKYLVDLDCYWAPETFVRRATPFDKIKDVPEGKATWKPEDLAVDAIFSQMLALPTTEHKMVYYHSMITETCKIAPGAIAPSLGRAIRFLYTNVATLDLELAHRFLDWFTHHLSNFDFQWKWKEWIEDVQLDTLYPRKAFILGTLDKEVRLSFAKRIRQTLPEEYQPLIPSSQDNDIPDYKYNNELTPYSQDAKQLVRMLRKKAPDAEVEGVLTRIASASQNPDNASDPNTNPSPADDDPAALLPAIDALATTICYIGSKSLSHVLSHIERQKPRLTILSTSGPDAQKQIISSVVAYWRDVQPGVAVNIIDKLLNYQILTPASVVEWALDPTRVRGGRLLASSWMYEMVEGTVRKVTGRLRQIVTARTQRGLPATQVELLEKALREEADGVRSLFATIEDALRPIAEGTDDAVLQGDANMEGVELGEEEQALCRLWGVKWARVFARKLRIEETVLAEMSKSFPPPAEEDPIVLANGVDGGGQQHADDAQAVVENGNGIGRGPEEDLDVDVDIS